MSEKFVIITGASRGIGKECAFVFAKLGYNILAVSRNKDGSLYKLNEELNEKYPVKCICLSGDCSDESFTDLMFSSAANLGQLCALINNAGIDHMGLLQDMTLDEWNNIFKINVTSIFLSCKKAIPLFLHEGGGSIVNVSSVWGNAGASFEVAYSATKGAVNSFTKALAKELAPSNIRVNAAAFGVIDTAMNDCLSSEEKSALKNEIPLERFGTPTEAADLIVSLSLFHPYMTGQVITLDGGWIPN